jgi:hypothetical protein
MVCCLNYSTDPYVKPIVGVADASSKEVDGHKETGLNLLPEPKPRHHQFITGMKDTSGGICLCAKLRTNLQ